jgi:hypothetical protein
MVKIPPALPDAGHPSWPRYWPEPSLPASPFIPGISPRSERQTINICEDLGVFAERPLTAENWPRHGPYLFGVDLFNHGFWWEAHERWEKPWRCGDLLQRPFLQGLIQLAASFLKWRVGNARGQEGLRSKGLRNLEAVKRQVGDEVYMGLGLQELVMKIDRHRKLLPGSHAATIEIPTIILCHGDA